MASLVTLGASPYSAYNTSFAGIALQGLSMAQREMEQRDAIAQRSYDNYMKSVQFGADLLFKNQEMQLNKRKFEFSVDQALFERKMAVEDQQFRREQFGEQKRQFDVGAGFEERRTGLAEDRFQFDKERYTDEEPVRELQKENLTLEVANNARNYLWAEQDRPLGIRTRQIQNAVALSNAATNIQNSDIAAANAETSALNAQTRREQLQQYDRDRAAGIRAYDSRIKQTEGDITDAVAKVTQALKDIKGSKKKTSPAVENAEREVERLKRQLEELKQDKNDYIIRYGGNADTGGPTEAPQTAGRRFLQNRRAGLDASQFNDNNTDSTFE